MAQRTIIVDDLSGKESLTTKGYHLSLSPLDAKDKTGGAEAQLDLDQASANALRTWLVKNDRRDLAGLLYKQPRRVPNSNGEATDADTEVIRTWARQQDEFKDVVKERGRISDDIRQAYVKAHPVSAS